MGLLVLAANQGSTIEIEVSGADAEQAMNELEYFLLHDTEDEDGESHEKGKAKS